MDKSIRIAQVIGNAANGGVESVISNYYENIDRNKFQFDFFVDGDSGIIRRDKIEGLGGRIFIIPNYKKNLFAFEKRLLNKFKEEKYLIVHSNMNTLSYFVLKQAKKANVPIRIAHSHSTSNKNEIVRSAIKNLLKFKSKTYATDYLACSELSGRWLFGNKTFFDGKVTILNNSVDINEFKHSPTRREIVRKELNIYRDAFVIGNVGRFVSQKNQKFLLEILYHMLTIKPNTYLLLVGEGPLEESLRKETKKLNIDSHVIFAGVHKHTARFYDAMDIFLLPSLYEGLPVSGVEAQVNGLTCFFSDKITDEVYGDLPLDRTDLFFTENTPIHTSSPYSASKASADLLVLAYHRTFNLPITISRCSNNYGPYHFPEKLIPLMIQKALRNESLPVYGNGSNVRDWLYVGDHCNAIDLVVRTGRDGEVYNIGGHNERTNLEVVKTILHALNKPESLISYVKDRLGHDLRYAMDPTKIETELGWKPEYNFDTGIVATIKWNLDNQEWIDHVESGEYMVSA